MSKVRVHIAVSADGYVAGPDPTEENPLGEGAGSLHDWAFALRAFREPHGMEGGEVNASTPVVEEALANVGAEIMGRGKFGGGPGPWGDDPWPGWWGEDPPFHMPVFVLTHHERDPLTLSDTTFTFVSEGIESALEQARAAAAGKDVTVGGGADGRQPRGVPCQPSGGPQNLGERRPVASAIRQRTRARDAPAPPGKAGGRGAPI
jgi:dihydrofolate reductase